MQKIVDQQVLVINPILIANDVFYLSKHALVYKFMGIKASLPFLKTWRWIR